MIKQKVSQKFLPLGKLTDMEAITLLTDKNNNHRLMQIDLDVLADNEELLEDIYDVIAIELRKNEETIPWEQVKQQLLNEGKL